MKNFHIFLLLPLLVICSSSVAKEEFVNEGKFSYSIKPKLDDWISLTKVPKSRSKGGRHSSEYALLDTQIISKDDFYSEYRYNSVYLHTSQAVAQQSEFNITFDPNYQSLAIHKIDIVRKGKAIDKLKRNNIRLLQREIELSNNIYDGRVTAAIIVPQTSVGDRLDISYTITGRNPIFGEKIFGISQVGWPVEVGLVNFRIIVPKDRPIQTRTHNTNVKVKKKTLGIYNEYRWSAKKVAAVSDEGDYPAWFLRFPIVEFSEYQSWLEVERWAAKLYATSSNRSARFDKIVDKIKSGSADKESYTSAALRYTQEKIRYLGLEIAENSHLPRKPDEVIHTQYGDCKDKSMLLINILKAENIRAYPALVSTHYQEGFDSFLPSPLVFNHVVVLVVIDGIERWLDPTKTFQNGTLSNISFTPFGKSLVVGRDKQKVIFDVKVPVDQLDKVSINEHFEIKEFDKDVLLTVKTVHEGSYAESFRYQYTLEGAKNLQKTFHNFYAKFYPNIRKVGKLELDDDSTHNRITVIEKYKISEFFKVNSDLFSASYYASSIDENLQKPIVRIRKSPIFVGKRKRVIHKITIDTPRDARIYIDSTPLIVSSPPVLFRSRSDFFSNRFEYEGELQVENGWVENESSKEYFQFVDDVVKDINFNLSFARQKKKDKSDTKNRLINSLGDKIDEK